MGMHFGIVACRLPLDALLPSFRELGVELQLVASLDRIEAKYAKDAARGDRNATYLIAGEHAGSSYLLDESMVLSAGQSDLLAAVADRTGALLVGCGAETVSGTFWFTAFRGQHLLRMFWMCRSDLAKPFSMGLPLPSEAAHPLDMDWDGDGIFAALAELGFDYNAWLAAGPFRLLTLENAPEPAARPLEAALEEHSERYRLSPDARPEISVVQRSAQQAPTLWQRVIRIFGK